MSKRTSLEELRDAIRKLSAERDALKQSADMWYTKCQSAVAESASYEQGCVVRQAEIDKLRGALISFTKSEYIKKQHPKRYAAALAALGERS